MIDKNFETTAIIVAYHSDSVIERCLKNLHNVNKIIVDNVLFATAKITEIFYPDSVTDDFDSTVRNISKTSFVKKGWSQNDSLPWPQKNFPRV